METKSHRQNLKNSSKRQEKSEPTKKGSDSAPHNEPLSRQRRCGKLKVPIFPGQIEDAEIVS